ncbi:hypothetical protein REJ26_004345 [Providencia stuartii]|uniref:hypothetical protein n=1 Tax=Providencia sp. 2023EL-00965 TaxID=3084975 RepID=UPI0028006C17|nr:hypothetical protein [Providencia sp. 2023EL-00965]ELR5084487.1 hypothetical protein [Providencia stuartii]ELR5302483.1 hypothetical protein [Providencia stuartii]MDW7590945.1 hypothetical protein [Providencia sp. 2023EL-00965]
MDWNKNKNYLNAFFIRNKDEKLNRNDEIIKFGEEIKEIYFEYLKKNDFKVFAKYDISKYCNYMDIEKYEHFEAANLKNKFKDNFKSKSNIRFKKDLVSTFVLRSKDNYDKDYYCYFCVDKKEYEERKDEYLEEFKNNFILTMKKEIKDRKEAQEKRYQEIIKKEKEEEERMKNGK